MASIGKAIAGNPTVAATECDYHFRILLIGDIGVGKKSIITRYVNGTFTSQSTDREDYVITVPLGSCIVEMEIELRSSVFGSSSGFGEYHPSSFFKNVRGVMLVCDLTNQYSLFALNKYLEEIQTMCSTHLKVLLLGNKCDLDLDRQASEPLMKSFAEDLDLDLMESSAKTGHNITEAFEYIASAVLNKLIFLNS